MNVIHIISRISSVIRKIRYKVIYGNRFQCKNAILGPNTKIYIGAKGKIIMKKNFCCRNNIILRVDSGVLLIEDNVFLNDNCSITCLSKITIGENSIFGQNIHIYDHDHNFGNDRMISEQGMNIEAVTIGRNVWVGAGCFILKGASIGSNSVIGANTVIKGTVGADALVYGKQNLVTRDMKNN
jgi:acetyltransferase-like isoleucine patch superfamily enzyme